MKHSDRLPVKPIGIRSSKSVPQVLTQKLTNTKFTNEKHKKMNEH